MRIVRTTKTTTTVIETEISVSDLTKSEQTLYDMQRSRWGNPEQELIRAIARYARQQGITEEEATHQYLHPSRTHVSN